MVLEVNAGWEEIYKIDARTISFITKFHQLAAKDSFCLKINSRYHASCALWNEHLLCLYKLCALLLQSFAGQVLSK